MSKPRLVIIPGWNINSRIFESYVQELNNQFEIIFFDPPQVTSNAYQAALQELSKIITPQTYLLGWSMGGQLAMLAASQTKTAGLFLFNTAAIFSRDEAGKKSFYTQCLENFPKALKHFHRLMGDLTIEQSLLLKKKSLGNKESALAYLQELHNIDLSDIARQLKVPTIIFHTEDDQIIPFSAGEELRRLIKSSEFCVLPGKKHFPFMDDYAKIFAQMRGRL